MSCIIPAAEISCRVLDSAAERPTIEQHAEIEEASGFIFVIMENLRTASVQKTRTAERFVFDRLEPWPGEWTNAAGKYTDADGTSRRVAVSLGPEQRTVGPVQVKEAAKVGQPRGESAVRPDADGLTLCSGRVTGANGRV